MLDEHLKLSTKWRISGKLFSDLVDAKTLQIKVPEYLGEYSCDSEIISCDILKTLLRLLLCQRNAKKYPENYVFLESGAKV